MKFRPIPGTLNPRRSWQRLISSDSFCSSFTLNPNPERLADQFGTDRMLYPLPDTGIFYPHDMIPVVRHNGRGRQFDRAQFGLDESRKLAVRWQIPAKLLAKMPWIDLFGEMANRCLIPLKDFTQKAKASPGGMGARYGFMGDEPVAWAGLCSDSGGDSLVCAGVMVKPNTLVSQYHGQMPLIVRQHDWDNWLKGSSTDMSNLLCPFDGPLTVSFVASDPWNTPVVATPTDLDRNATGSLLPATAAVKARDLILTADMAEDVYDAKRQGEHVPEDATQATTIANLERLVARAKGMF